MNVLRLGILIVMVFFAQFTSAQCAECPAGSIVITGTTNITDQNNQSDYCITGAWTGTITGIGNNSTVTICPSATWTLSSNFTSQQNIVITNYGTITDDGNDYLFKIQGQTVLINKSSGTITVEQFENQDTEFTNEGSLIAEDIYLHGPSFNSGTMESTATDCGGMATTGCGFFIGNKNQYLNNTGTIYAVDATLGDGVTGGGDFISTGTLTISNNSTTTDNNFIVNNLILQASGTVLDGIFVVNGDFDCNNATIEGIICLEGGTQVDGCSGSSNPIVQCLVLPVNFVSFDIKQSSSKLIYSWEVSSEIDLSHYEILESNDGRNFSKIREVEATNARFYQTVGEAKISEVSYYKLRSVDVDGTVVEFNQVRVVRNTDVFSFSVSPNPVDKRESLAIKFENRQDALVQVYNLTGEKLLSIFVNDQDKFDLNLEEIQVSGLYLIQVSTPSGIYTKEIYIH